MKQISPEELSQEKFARFGQYSDLSAELSQGSGEWKAAITRKAWMTAPLLLGITSVKSGDFLSVRMERHVLSEEILLCANDDMVLTVADSDPEGVPLAEDVRSFFMRKGQIVLLNKGIWHDANHGVEKDVIYYFLTTDFSGKEIAPDAFKREIEWVSISPEPVRVSISCSEA